MVQLLSDAISISSIEVCEVEEEILGWETPF